MVVTIVSFIAASYLRNALIELYPFGSSVRWQDYVDILIVTVFTWRGLLGFQDAYRGQRYTSLKTDIWIIFKTICFGTLIVLTVAFMIKSSIPRSLITIFAVVNFFLLMEERIHLYQFIGYVRAKEKNIKKVFVLGVGDIAKAFVDSVRDYPDWGIKIIGLICKNKGDVGTERFGYKLVGCSQELEDLLHQHPIDEMIIALPAKHLGTVEDVMSICDKEGVPIRIISPFFKNLISKTKTDTVHGIPVIKFSSVDYNEFATALKRAIDMMVSFVLLVLLIPVFFGIAILIKIDSKGPVFYRWKVLGLNKMPLISYKFRTMVENSDALKKGLESKNEMSGPAFKIEDDPRVTKVGKWLRKFSLDELPQLWSVLKGDLALVGPRPPLQTEVEKYEGWHRRKLSVKPGITCLWQVSGRNEINDFDDWMRLDMKYIDEWSLWLDVKILFKTVWVVLRGTGK